MSNKGLEAFLQAVLDDDNLQEQLKTGINERGIESSHELVDLAVEIGAEHGFEFSRDDAQVSIDKMIMAGQRGPELSSAELDRVAGGVPAEGGYAPQSSPRDGVVQKFQLERFTIGP